MKIRTILCPALVAMIALSTAACGGDQPEAKQSGSGGLTKVTLDAIEIAQVATFVLAQEQGIFEKHGIDLDIKFVEPPALVPSLMSGDADFVWANPPGLLAARSNNVPLKMVTTVSVAGDDPTSFPIQVMVPEGSDIKTVADLAGKKVATGLLFITNDLALRASLEEVGVDYTSVDFVEVPSPNMGDALDAGRVDAIISTEPFVSITKQTGQAIPLASVTEGMSPTTGISGVASSEKFIGENSDLVDDFRAAVDEAMDYANAHEDELRATVPTITEITPELAAVIDIAPIDTTDDPAAWDAWADLLVDVGVVDEKPDSSDAFLAD